MNVIKVVIGLILLVLLCSLPARAQYRTPGDLGSTLNALGSLNGQGSMLSGSNSLNLSYSPPTPFRVILVSGSEETFVPSAFMTYDQAVALGAGDSHPVFMSYDQAVEKGIADLNSKAKSVAEAAREYRSARQQRRPAESMRAVNTPTAK
jgi:hypothetical protein